MTGKIVVLSTCPNLQEAEKIARHLLEQRLAACVSLVPAVRSLYWWQGSIDSAEEFLLLIKTRRDLFDQLRSEITRLHSYQVPELLCLEVCGGLPAYLEWVDAELRPVT